MAKITKTELKTLLQAMARQQPRAHARLSKSERAASKLVADWMRKSGLDTKALAALEDERRLEIQRFVEKERAKAVKQAAISHAVVRDQAKALQTLAKKGEFFTVPSFTLNKPVRITASPRKILRMSRVKPFDSFAKIRVDRTENGQDKLSFLYEWRNSSLTSVAIDAVTFLSESGFVELSVSGGATFHFGFLTGTAQIALGPSSRKSITYETRNIGALSAVNNPLLPGDGHDSGGFFNAFNLTALHHPVAPNQTVVIVVSMIIDSDCFETFKSTTNFRTKADFESGSLGVSCPVVVVRVHQMPPVSTPD